MEVINAVGRRKASIARVFLKKGKGNITINGKDYKEYIHVAHHIGSVEQPINILEVAGKYDITVNVRGGGVKGQAEAIRLGISRAFVVLDAENKPALKAEGLMTRDSKVVERKKYGRRKARKIAQFSKR
jgi:small subunit ribosomal protein S9|tara:strand:- start:219 stop:605 length:387 start_codon:yes stop_codon:yes gene_type:complete